MEKDTCKRPFVLSEYGGFACEIPGHISAEGVYGYHNVTPEEFPERFRTLMEEIKALRPKGLSGAVYTQLSDIEEEINGLLTYDRKLKI